MATIQEAIEYSKVNPDTAFANELRRRIESGQMNTELEQAGLKQYITAPSPKKELTTGQKVEDFAKGYANASLGAIEETGKGVLNLAGKGIKAATGVQLPQAEGLGIDAMTQPNDPTQKGYYNAGKVATIVGPGVELGVEKAVVGGAKALTKLDNVVATQGAKAIEKVVPDSASIMQRVARIPKSRQAAFEKTAGESVGEYLVKRDIYGDEEQIATQLYKRFTDSKNTADEALAKLPGNYQPEQVKTALNQLLEKKIRVSAPGADDAELARVKELVNKFETEGLNMTEINEAKRLFERNVKTDFIRENKPEGVTQANNIDNAIREWQFKKADELGLKNLPEINKETRLARQLLDDLTKESAGAAGNNAFSLTDYILLAGGDPTAIGTFLAKKGLDSKKLQSAVAKRLAPKEGKIGKPEAKTN